MPSRSCHAINVVLVTAFTTLWVFVPGAQGIHSNLAPAALRQKGARSLTLPRHVEEWNRNKKWYVLRRGTPNEVVIVWNKPNSSPGTHNVSNNSNPASIPKKSNITQKNNSKPTSIPKKSNITQGNKESANSSKKEALVKSSSDENEVTMKWKNNKINIGGKVRIDNSKGEHMINISSAKSLVNSSGQASVNRSNKTLRKEQVNTSSATKDSMNSSNTGNKLMNSATTKERSMKSANTKEQLMKSANTKEKMSGQEKASSPKTHIISLDIYYGTMDYYSKQFFQSSLVPLWKDEEIRARIKLNLHPYGKTGALNDTGWLALEHPENHFKCEHGTAECFKTALENCAIVHLNDPDLYVPFVTCFVEKINISRTMEMGLMEHQDACFSSGVINNTMMDDIMECADTSEGLRLMSTAGQATTKLQDPSEEERGWADLPWIVLNGRRADSAEQDGKAGETGYLLKEICETFAYPIPTLCVLDVQDKEDQSPAEAGEDPFIAEDEKLERQETVKTVKRPEQSNPFIAEDERPEREGPAEVKDSDQDEPFVAEDEKVPNQPFEAADEQIDND